MPLFTLQDLNEDQEFLTDMAAIQALPDEQAREKAAYEYRARQIEIAQEFMDELESIQDGYFQFILLEKVQKKTHRPETIKLCAEFNSNENDVIAFSQHIANAIKRAVYEVKDGRYQEALCPNQNLNQNLEPRLEWADKQVKRHGLKFMALDS